MEIANIVITSILCAPWAVLLVAMTRGIFKKSEDLFEPVHIPVIENLHYKKKSS